MFFAKNIALRGKLGMPIRGRNREANLSIVFFGLFIIVSLLLGVFDAPFEKGIYRFSRNPYFLSYLIMFVAYTVLLRSIILLILSLVGFAVIHAMVLKEERHLTSLHGDTYRTYRKRVPRYLII
jgi:hypothetical protein